MLLRRTAVGQSCPLGKKRCDALDQRRQRHGLLHLIWESLFARLFEVRIEFQGGFFDEKNYLGLGLTASSRRQGFFTPYFKANRFVALNGPTDLVPGIKSIATPGHTAGHSTCVVESKGQKLVLWGDLIHVAAVQFDEPVVTIQFDTDTDTDTDG